MHRSLIVAIVALAAGCITPKGEDGGSTTTGADAGGCSRDADCGSDSYCSNGQCVPQHPSGTTCSGNDQCVSGICGVVGSGHCCAVACVQDSSHSCGPDDCNDVGVCSYPCGANCTKDTDCRDPRICDHGSCVYPDAGGGTVDAGNPGPQCLIGGQFVPAGTTNPANSCQACDPSNNQLDWTTNFQVAAIYTSPAGTYPSGPWKFASTVGGPPDLVIVGESSNDGTSNQVHVLDADLTVLSSFPLSGSPSYFATLDLNADGFNDLVFAGLSPDYSTNLVSLFVNDAHGGLTPGAVYPSEAMPDPSSGLRFGSLATGDFYGDGTQQLSVAMDVYTQSLPNGVTRLDLYSLAGDGGLAVPVSADQVPGGGSHQAGDFNGDGKTDVLWNSYLPPSNTALTLTLSTGGGQFAAPTPVSLPLDGGYYGGTAIVVADFNGDGRSDLAIANSDDTISLELSDDQGTLGAPVIVATQPSDGHYYSPSLLAGDFNGDGNQDLLQVGGCCAPLMIFLGVGDGTFLPPIAITAGPPLPPSEPTIGYALGTTLDRGNGRPDLALFYGYYVAGQPYQGIVIFHNGCK